MSPNVKAGDFTHLASDYAKYRPDYSPSVIRTVIRHAGLKSGDAVADVGAGTGIFSMMLRREGLDVTAVEPNEAMRAEGRRMTESSGIRWAEGRGESTNLPSGAFGWVTMASSFHWVDPRAGLKEFRRILVPGGYFTAIWNPRDIQGHPLHEQIEAIVREQVPGLKRRSSGMGEFADRLPELLVSTGEFDQVFFVEEKHSIPMTPERYLGAWRSVNDIQEQAGPANFALLMSRITDAIHGLAVIEVPYRTRSWTVRSVKS